MLSLPIGTRHTEPAQGSSGSRMWIACGVLIWASGVVGGSSARDTARALLAADEAPSVDSIRAAVDRSIPLLERGAKGSMEQRANCFTCHNQGLPILALTTARDRGWKIDEEHLRQQVDFTAAFLQKNADNYREGKGQGGQVDTAGYALWALNQGKWKADELTSAVAEYLLRYQNDKNHWQSSSRRPPTEQSTFTSTYLAVRGLKTFATEPQTERVAKRLAEVQQWLAGAKPEDTEDRVFRLRLLHLLERPAEEQQAAREELVQAQRMDGGWAQLPDLTSDAYATGSVLVALHQAGGLPVTDPAYQRGLAFLITNQKEDGSWHVVSRSKPFQKYFESGYPHGKDQFISIAAAGWSTMALALATPVPAAPDR